MNVPTYSVILVDSTSHAMRVENVLFKNDIQSKLIPVPRHLSSDCGVCVRISGDQVDSARAILEKNRIGFRSIAVHD